MTAALFLIVVASCLSTVLGQSPLLYAVHSDEHTWTQAEIACRAMGGHLAMPVDADAQETLEEYVSSVEFADASWEWVHIGLRQSSPSEDFEFANGALLSSFDRWRDGRPNNTGMNADDCVAMRVAGGAWDDVCCQACDGLGGGDIDYRLPFVCEEQDRYYLTPDAMTWDAAAVDCASRQSSASPYFDHLGVVRTDVEFGLVSALAERSGVRRFWIGARNTNAEGTFEWIDGSPFLGGGPSEANVTESCLQMVVPEDGGGAPYLDNAPCGSEAPFLCRATDPFVFVAHDPPLTWNDAEAHCASLNPPTHLASIHSQRDNDVLRALDPNPAEWLHIGLHVPPGFEWAEENFTWNDGSDVGFTLWADGEPNFHDNAERCVEMREYGEWNDIRCDAVEFSPFACQRALPTLPPTSSPKPSPTAQPSLMPTSVPTPAPSAGLFVDRVQFSSNGAQLFVTFNLDTDRSNVPLLEYTPCEEIVDIATLSLLGSSPRCRWASNSQIEISLGPAATLIPHALAESDPSIGQISFASSFQLSAFQASPGDPQAALVFDTRGSYSVGFPDVLEAPRARLVVPQSAPTCVALTLDASGSTGFAGRPARYLYSSTCDAFTSGDSGNTTLQIISESSLTVAPNTLADGQVCDFSLTVENFLGARSETVDARVTGTASSALSVTMTGPSGEWTVPRGVTLFADAELTTCDGESASSASADEMYSFVWTVVDSRSGKEVSNSWSDVVLDTATLDVPAYSFEVDKSYEFHVSVEAAGRSADASTVLAMVPSSLVAAIDRPTRFEWPAHRELSVDASGSRDPDVDPAADPDDASDHLIFEWSCVRLSDASPCLVSLPPSALAGAHLTVPPGALAPGDSYALEVSVSSALEGDGRSASARTSVTIAAAAVPLVSITGDFLIGIEDTLRLEGTAVSADMGTGGTFNFSWRETSGALDLKAPASLPFLRTPTNGRNLVIDAGLLQPFQSYTFELVATAADTQITGRAEAVVQVLHGPSIAEFGVMPFQNPRNTEETLYRLQASAFGASSDSEPFEYRFSYVRVRDEGGSGLSLLEDSYVEVDLDEVVLDDFSFSSSTTARLLAGNYTMHVDVRDAFGVLSRATVADFEAAGGGRTGPCAELALLEVALDGALARSNVAEVLQLATSLGASVGLSEYDSCRESVGLREALFAILSDLQSSGSFVLSHAQSLAAALLTLVKQGDDDTTPLHREDVAISARITEDLLEFSRTLLDEGNVPQAKILTLYAGQVLSRLLGANLVASDENSAEVCAVISSVRSQLETLFELELDPLLAGEDAATLITASISGGAVHSDLTDNGMSLTGGGSSLTFHANLTFSDYNSDSDSPATSSHRLVIITLDSASSPCFEDVDMVSPIGPIVIITTDGNISMVEFTLNFTLTDEQAAYEASLAAKAAQNNGHGLDLCDEPEVTELECRYYNTTTNEWRTNGCEVVGRTDFNETSGVLHCRCYHLTTFAVIRSVRAPKGCFERLPSAVVYPFVIIYIILGVYTFRQTFVLYAIWRQRSKNSTLFNALLSDALISAECATQVTWLLLYQYTSGGASSAVLVSVFVSAARVLLFWIVSLIIYQWLTLVEMTLSLRMADAVSKTKRALIAVVVLLAIVIVILFVVLATVPTTADRPFFDTVERAGALIVATFNVLIVAAFFVCAFLLIRGVRKSFDTSGMKYAPSVASLSSSGSSSDRLRSNSVEANKGRLSPVLQRIFNISTAFCLVFLAQSTIVLISGIDLLHFQGAFVAYQTAYSALDVVSLLVVVYIFRSVISTHEKTVVANSRKSEQPSTKHRKSSWDTSKSSARKGGTPRSPSLLPAAFRSSSSNLLSFGGSSRSLTPDISLNGGVGSAGVQMATHKKNSRFAANSNSSINSNNNYSSPSSSPRHALGHMSRPSASLTASLSTLAVYNTVQQRPSSPVSTSSSVVHLRNISGSGSGSSGTGTGGGGPPGMWLTPRISTRRRLTDRSLRRSRSLTDQHSWNHSLSTATDTHSRQASTATDMSKEEMEATWMNYLKNAFPDERPPLSPFAEPDGANGGSPLRDSRDSRGDIESTSPLMVGGHPMAPPPPTRALTAARESVSQQPPPVRTPTRARTTVRLSVLEQAPPRGGVHLPPRPPYALPQVFRTPPVRRVNSLSSTSPSSTGSGAFARPTSPPLPPRPRTLRPSKPPKMASLRGRKAAATSHARSLSRDSLVGSMAAASPALTTVSTGMRTSPVLTSVSTMTSTSRSDFEMLTRIRTDSLVGDESSEQFKCTHV